MVNCLVFVARKCVIIIGYLPMMWSFWCQNWHCNANKSPKCRHQKYWNRTHFRLKLVNQHQQVRLRTKISIFYQFFQLFFFFTRMLYWLLIYHQSSNVKKNSCWKINCQSRKWQKVRMRCHRLDFDMNYGAFTVMCRVVRPF